ncbi:phosphoenolpyruvate--protein phosphotransferase [uncultured Tyzzerella sp.]|uniref:phosphoenolpyruvate--protein phosphotransferase n=1 Tax=uncultured Tyzzerella sp. TaxID=2321398 RepID=UPI0029434178|nr:phosphoenolpyruvate--protein phosphotransferase [uncultured Tyzzerella sp.]
MSKKLFVEKTSSKGIVIGKAYVIQKADLTPENYAITSKDEEINKFKEALKEAKQEIENLAKDSEIFQGHNMIVEDITLYDAVISRISDEMQNVQVAVANSIEEISNVFRMMDDEYMKERATDVKDVGSRIMSKLKGINVNPFENIKEEVVLIAEDLTPSDTALIDLSLVKGVITELGGVTSHLSIIARNLSLPALVGVNGIIESVVDNDIIVMDAYKGNIIINPEVNELEEYKNLQENFNKQEEMLKKLENLKAITKDGREVQLCANVGNILDIEMAVKHNIDGIGLFRSECLYMESTHFPTEEEQFKVYKQAALLCKDKEVTIRTLDIGGDKSLPYYKFDFEENPFLGWRAIRISLELKDVFKAQLKAILRASAFGYIRIMYPMIISIEEIIEANKLLEQCKQELRDENIKFDEKIEVGIMIETPASVILADEFAKYVDFFSIGTNDLTQYMLVVDRGNKKISNMYNSFHPVVLQSIKKVIDAGHKENIKVGMCGEFASDEKAAKILLGLGLDEFSMSASEINKVKKHILETSFTDAKNYANEVLSKTTVESIMDFLEK